jgi:hypothetical protein
MDSNFNQITMVGVPSVSRMMPWWKSRPVDNSRSFTVNLACVFALPQFLITKHGFTIGLSGEPASMNRM